MNRNRPPVIPRPPAPGVSRRRALQLGAALAAGVTGPAVGVRPAAAVSRRRAQQSVTIRVDGGTTEEAKQEDKEFFAGVVERFEAAHPGVTLEPVGGGYNPEAFAAKVAGGTLEDAFGVWFTEPPRFIRQGIVADITDQIKTWEHFAAYTPNALQPVTNAEGRVFGIPTSVYALSLVYNRKLFRDAGLDPARPPATWDDLRAAARQIAERTGVPGYGFLSAGGQGGWHLTTMLYTFGADPVRAEGGGLVQAVNEEPTVRALTLLKEMRWADRSMTEQQQLDQSAMNELLATGQVAMAIGQVPGDLITQYEANLEDYGLGVVPQGGGNAVLGGGYAYMFNAESSPEQLRAAIDWVLFRNFDQGVFEEDLDNQLAQDLLVGFPEPALHVDALQTGRDAARAAKANVPTDLYAPFVDGMKTIEIRPEPTGFDVQRLYAALDPAVQAVLTDDEADPQALLDEAAARVQTEVIDPA